MEPIDWMSTSEVADMIGLTPRTVHRLIDAGELPAYRFGRVIRYRRLDVLEFLESKRIEPGCRDTIESS